MLAQALGQGPSISWGRGSGASGPEDKLGALNGKGAALALDGACVRPGGLVA